MKTALRTLMCLILLLAGLPWQTARAAAALPGKPLDLFDLGAPSFTTFSTHDGLPASIIAEVKVDNQGFVWASTARGLARYDGNRWETTGAFAIRGVLGSPMVTHDGTLWVAFRDRGIARFDGTRWRFPSGFPTKNVRHLAETRDAQGHWQLWALTPDDGLLRQEGDRWVPGPDAAGLPRTVLSIASTRGLGDQPRLWAGTGMSGLWYREGNGHWQRFHAPGFAAAQIEDLLVTHRNGREQLWISTFGDGLWRLDDAGLHGWTMQTGDVPTNDFYNLAQSELPNGDVTIWAASRAGLVRIHDDRARIFDRSYGLPSDVVRDITIWHSPNGVQVMWLATENGVARAIVGPHSWQFASLLGARASGVFATLVDHDDQGNERLWVGATDDGLGLYKNGQWRHFTTANGLPADSVSMIKHAPDERGNDDLWIGFSGGDLARVLPGPRFRSVPVPWDKGPAQAVADMLDGRFDGHQELWVGTRTSGLYRRRDGRWMAMAPAGAPARWAVTGLARQTDARGRQWLWATSSLGLIRYDGHGLHVFDTAWGLPKALLLGVTLIPQHGKQVLWLGSMDGIVRVDVTDPEHPRILPDDLPPPPDPVVYDALQDSRGRIYLCTNNGVQQLLPATHGYASRVFTRSDGMPHDECNHNAQFIDSHDRYWVGTLGGLGVYDPANERSDHQPKPLRITGVWIDNVATSSREIVLRPGQKYLRVQYALLSWFGNDKSAFRTRLVGDEAAPDPWTHQNQREFDHLPPGDYTLRIEARDYAGNLSTPVDLSIRVLPAWWQTVWARAAFALTVAVLFFLLWQWRIRALKAQRRRLEEQVSARTAELNAANARLKELSYHDALTGLANRRKLHQALEEAAVEDCVGPWSLIFVDVDHFKRFNDQFGHPGGDEALRVVAASMQACAPEGALIARYGGEEFACLLPGTTRAGALKIAECMRAGVASRDVVVPDAAMAERVTISAGVAERRIASIADSYCLLHDADIAMYQAKGAGRNCVRG